ncbi:MAG: cytochrome P450 [Acidimicrobiales bacterium]
MDETQLTEAAPHPDDPFDEFNRAMGADGDASPYPDLIEQRARGPIDGGGPLFVAPDGGAPEAQVFTAYSYEAVHTVLCDSDSFSSAAYADFMGLVLGRSILQMDEPEHHTYRTILQQAFTRKEMARWQNELVAPLVHRMIDDFIDDGRADLVRQLTFPFPVRVIAALIGLPEADLPTFHRLAVELIGVTVDWDRALRASEELRRWFADIVADRRRHPADDLISVLASAHHDGRRLTDDEIYAFLRLLLPAGAETTYRSSSNLLFGLLSDRSQLDAVRTERTLLPQAIEEGLRWEPPLLIILRTATHDTKVCGVPVPAGASIICNLGSANHDESRWPEPERFDIFRARRPHVGFALGPHLCLGMHLARMETEVALTALFDRLDDLRLDPSSGEQFISGMTFRAPLALDVVWG